MICVREHDTASILAAYRERLGHEAIAEQRTALAEIGKIVRLRLEDLDERTTWWCAATGPTSPWPTGVIAAIGPELAGARAEIDARGLHVLPGVVDAHVHLNDPGRADWEGWSSGTLALAAGGATCCVDMPLNSHPPTLDGASFDAKVTAARGAARVDFALWGGLVPGPLDRMDELAARGAVGLQGLHVPERHRRLPGGRRRGPRGRHGPRGAPGPARRGARRGRGADRGAGRPRRRRGAHRRCATSWPRGRPRPSWRPSRGPWPWPGRPAARCTWSTSRPAAASAWSREARARGVDVTCETCPHYLVLDADDAEALGAVAKCAPPLRPPADREDLGRSSPAAPSTGWPRTTPPARRRMKAGADMFAAWGGIAGAQTLLALALTHDPGLDAAALLAARPAERLRLPGKGRLEVGADADLVLVDRSRPWRLRAGDLRQRHPLSPYVGRELRARAVRTIVRGRTVWPPEGPPAGRLVTPPRTASSMLGR